MSEFNRNQLFEEYFESSYKHGNVLDEKQMECNARYFELVYQPHLPQHQEANILDFGCGVGDFLFYLKKKGYRRFFGVDISKQQIDYCLKHVSEHAATINGLEFLQDKTGQYDCVTANDVMEHIPKNETMHFLNLIYESLKSGGVLILRVPNMSNPFGLDARFNDFTHEVGFTSKSLYQVLWLAGFRDITILPPIPVDVQSWKNWIRKYFVMFLHQVLRFCFYIQDYSVPKNLDKNLVVVARK